MQSFINNFLAGDPGTVIIVGIIFFFVLFIVAFFIFGYTVKMQAESGFTFAFLVVLSLMLPFALRQSLLQQQTATQATPAVQISQIRFQDVDGKQQLQFITSLPALVYLEFTSDGKTTILIPTYLMTRRSEHAFELNTIPAEVSEVTVVINGQRSDQRISIP